MVGKNRNFTLQYKGGDIKTYKWILIKKSVGQHYQTTVQFLLSSNGFIIGDSETDTRLLTEYDDVLPNSY